MRTPTGIALLTVLVLGVAGTAGAAVIIDGVTIPNGPIVINYRNYDVGTRYNVQNGKWTGEGALDGLAQTGPVGGLPNEDSWGIFRVDSITDTTGTIDYYNRWTASTEITGLLWGERDTYLDQTDVAGAVTQDIHGIGMCAAFFEDSTPDFDPTPGPTARVGNTYPTVTDGQLIWTFNSVPGWDISFPADEFFTTFRPNAAVGDTSANGGMFAATGDTAIGTGSMNDLLDPDGIAVGVAGRADFTGLVGTLGWDVNSYDPFKVMVIPEPATLALLALGGIVLIRRRRR